MNKEEKEKLVKSSFEGYLEMAENEEKITIDLNSFSQATDLCDENGDLDLNLESELNTMLVEEFKKNGYSTYINGEIYVYDGKFVTVQPDVVIAIKK